MIEIIYYFVIILSSISFNFLVSSSFLFDLSCRTEDDEDDDEDQDHEKK